MSYVDRRRSSTPREPLRRRAAASAAVPLRTRRVVGAMAAGCVVSGALQLFAGGPVQAGTVAAPLTVALAPYAGDAVTATPTSSALAGTDVTYQATVSNTTASDQTNVAVTLALAPNFSLQTSSVNPSTGTTAVSAGTLTWSLPTLAAGASATLSYTETADAPAAMESDTTSAAATSDQSSAAAVSAAVEVIPAADLTLSVSDGTATVAPGLDDTETLTVTNAGPSDLHGAAVSAVSSGGFALTGSSSSVLGTTFTDLGGGQYQWSGLDLPAGATATMTLTGQVSPSLATGTVLAILAGVTVSANQVDTGPAPSAVDADVVQQAAQSIAFSAPTTGIAGQSTTLVATGGGSGNPVIFSVDQSSGAGVCSTSGVDGSWLTYGTPGVCVVDADQAGNVSYAPAPTVTASIAVEQPPVFTQDAPPTTATVGQPYHYTFGASGSPSPSYSLGFGAPSWLSVDPAAGAVSGTPPAGTTSFNYSVNAINGAGSVTAGPFSVTVSAPAPSSPDADLAVALSCPATVRVQTLVTCSLVVTNAGPSTARSVMAAVALPRWSTRTGATAGALWLGRDTLWFAGSIAAGSFDRFTVCFRVAVPGTSTVAGAALSMSPDPNYANNVAQVGMLVTS